MVLRAMVGGGVVMALLGAAAYAEAQTSSQELRRLSLEDLMKVEITTLSRVPEAGALAPAAVHVITQEDIRRSGATTIVEALRLAPGVQVARIDANKWAVGMRGFPDRLARSMLVLIDGRAVYSPLFAGTYWEVQDLLLSDIDRIEVIRGPGGTLWGANAVNGIISIVTKDASASGGLYVEGGGGSQERAYTGMRYGGSRGADLHYRAYAKFFDRGPYYHADGDNFDDWRTGQAGFRVDRRLARQRTLTMQGDLYKGRAGQRSQLTTYAPSQQIIDGGTDLSGGNFLARWTSPHVRLQAYYDRTNRDEPTFRELRNTADLDLQHTLPIGRHELLWGSGYRVSSGDTRSVPTQQLLPNDRTDHLFTGFVQDGFKLVSDRVRVALGAKFEHNPYSGFEVQPSGRLVWTPGGEQAVILSVTRAVRTPSRVEQDFERTSLLDPAIPLYLRLVPNRGFEPERLLAYEAGYRVRFGNRIHLTAAGFFNHLTDILSTETSPIVPEATPAPAHMVLPLVFANGLHGNTHGAELTADWRAIRWLRWTATYSLLRVQLTRNADSRDASQEARGENLSPRHQLQSQASADLPAGFELDWLFRYVGELPTFRVPSYATSDLRLGYRLNPALSLAVVGRDLHHGRHLEFPGGSAGNVEVPRSVHGAVTWRW